MPTYEYACRQCGEHLEVVQSFKDDPLTDCPNCHGELRKVFSAAGIIFKGSGWHIKDYGGSKGSGASTNSSSSDGGTSPSESKPGDSKSGDSKTGDSKASDSSGSSSTSEPKSA